MTRYWAQRWPGGDRLAGAVCALLVNAMIGYGLIAGLRSATLLRMAAESAPLALFDLKPPPEEKPEPAQPAKPRAVEREGGARPGAVSHQAKNIADMPRPADIVAPVPVVALPAPVLPAVTLPDGADTSSDTAGTGSGGNGRGSGGTGAGTGGLSGDGGTFSAARQTAGRFRNSDFPESARGAGRLKIGVRYAIGPSGHVDKCEVIEGSGYAEVDAMTCRVIEERYRFRPARDPEGGAVTEVREEDYRWRVR